MPITALADDAEHHHWDQQTGHPTVMLFGNAVQVWSIAQERPVTVNEAALAFNVSPDLVRQAVEEHPWMFVGADGLIDHDGE